jgi:hypothetical protein
MEENTLGTEISRSKNIEPSQQRQEPLDVIREVQQTQKAQRETLKSIQKSIQNIERTQQDFHRDLIIRENVTTQLQNKRLLRLILALEYQPSNAST